MSIRAIQELYKQRNDLLRAEGSLTRQIKSIARRLNGGDSPQDSDPHASYSIAADSFDGNSDSHTCNADQKLASIATAASLPLSNAREIIHKEKLGIERELKKLTKKLPLHSFVDETRGVGTIGLATIIGEAGDLTNYANPAKLWMRMGMAVIDGKRQRKCKDKELAIRHGYNPRRRAAMHCIGDSIVKVGGPYRLVYDERKVLEIAKAPELPPIAHHKRAMRYMEKRLLRDLWREANAAEHQVFSTIPVAALASHDVPSSPGIAAQPLY